ncbi:Putative metal-dependent hydrolase [Septoria linicola]|uniref:Metal-dependent hydrolase n=1 Tax=Septoria linicola TaxID=215465 RepID=A0A9Q9AWK1_9PEZI|nr:putative metal-dependent hydrolase [Septoria linicola]USW53413.1 Putative metal-dependent hydrolase [Septoria linicola]
MAPLAIIDSHIHLWPESMSNEQGHAWMTPGMPLAEQHVLADYYKAAQQEAQPHASDPRVEGVVYVETDVRYDTPNGDLKSWAKGPLDEIRFLRDIVESKYGERDSKMLIGIVAWAPMDEPTSVLDEWLQLAEETAGPQTWQRIKGFRFLLQAIHDQEQFQKLVWSDDFINNLKLLGKRGFAFDVGVDQTSGGVWQLQAIAIAMEKAHRDVPEGEKVVFVLNHLCKPKFGSGDADFPAWKAAIKDTAGQSKTYMKLSGAFSELPEDVLAKDDVVNAVAEHVKPWVEHVFAVFGPEKVMFGSDWPVCNVRGPAKESSWVAWKDVVVKLLGNLSPGLADEDKTSIWSGNVRKAYGL